MGKKLRIRIVKKSKEGCILDLRELGLKSITWKQFNESFIIEDKVWAACNTEMEEAQKKIDEIVGTAFTFWLMSSNPNATPTAKLTGYSGLAGCQKKLEEEFGIDRAEFLKLLSVRKRALDKFFPNSVYNTKEERDSVPVKKPEYKNATNSLGELCPGLAKIKNEE